MQVKVGRNEVIATDGGAGIGSKPIGSASPPAAFRCTMRLILKETAS